MVRKSLNSAFTTIVAGNHTIQATLLNLMVLLCAGFAHAKYQPFVHKDANLAESLTVVSSILVLVVGLGQQAAKGTPDLQTSVQLDRGDDVTTEILSTFNYGCYAFMGLFVVAAIAIVVRRAGGAWFLYAHAVAGNATLEDSVADMLHKSKIDTANSWAAVRAQPRDLKRIETVFESIRAFQLSTDLKLDKSFARYFPTEIRPALYAWMASAPSTDVDELQWFVQELYTTKLEQRFATIPPFIRQRLIKAGSAPQIPIAKGGSSHNIYLSRSTRFESDSEDDDGTRALEMSLMSNADGSNFRQSLSAIQTEERLRLEAAERRLQRRWSRALRWAEARARFFVVATIIMVVVVGVWQASRHYSQCCPGNDVNNFGEGIAKDSCGTKYGINRMVDGNCKAQCISEAWVETDPTKMNYVCKRSASNKPYWEPVDSKNAPACTRDICKPEPGSPNVCGAKEAASCDRDTASKDMNYTCICRPGYGKNGTAEKDPCNIDYCDPSPCMHDGTCQRQEKWPFYNCDCSKKVGTSSSTGYKGTNCTERLSPCVWPKKIVCEHDGSCISSNATAPTAECKCVDGFIGDRCQIANSCQGVDCGQGTCHNRVCICLLGFSGEHCNIKDCREDCGLHGQCKDGVCACSGGFSGTSCKLPPADCKDGTSTYGKFPNRWNCHKSALLGHCETEDDVKSHCPKSCSMGLCNAHPDTLAFALDRSTTGGCYRASGRGAVAEFLADKIFFPIPLDTACTVVIPVTENAMPPPTTLVKKDTGQSFYWVTVACAASPSFCDWAGRWEVSSSATLRLLAVEISNQRSAEVDHGAAIHCDSCTLVLHGVKIQGNQAKGGGAVHVQEQASLELLDSTVTRNVGGGAIVLSSLLTISRVHITNTKFGGNSAGGGGSDVSVALLWNGHSPSSYTDDALNAAQPIPTEKTAM